MLRSFLYLALSLSFYTCHPVFAQNSASWKILKTSWSSADEQRFAEFVTRIGDLVETRACHSVTQCLNSSANTYRQSDPSGLRYFSDCADFPYFMRAYFAFKNGLPFSFASEMNLRNTGNNHGDSRYSAYGNQVAAKMDVVSKNGQFANALTILNEMIPNQTDSGNYRLNYKDNDTGVLFSDFYPVRLNREAIAPGTILYDPNGHVTMVYRVSDDGKIFYVDAHPDNSLTTGTFSIKFVRSNPGQGAGFKNWRPVKLVGATQNNLGYWIGGQIVGTPNSDLPLYSAEQFFGTDGAAKDWTQSKFVYENRSISYYEYVRIKMAKGNLRIQPIDDFREVIQDLCQSIQDRVSAVDVALRAGIQNKSHPERLPTNIYGTQGEWETYSTPSRDAQLKVSFRDLIDQADGYRKKIAANDPTVVYSGSDLFAELKQVYQSESSSCQISYTNSVGQAVSLNLEQVRTRLFALSFDPYHCPELRWGAQGQELSTCADGQEKRTWYAREQRLRNQHIRRYDIRMDMNLSELAEPTANNGVSTPIDIDVVQFLSN